MVKSRWDKMARWAGLGDNRGDAAAEEQGSMGAQDEMVEEMKDGLDPEIAGGAQAAETGEPVETQAETLEAGQGAGLESELAQMRGERDQLLDRLARLQAEFDNARKREAKERADAREYAVGSTLEPFFGVMDNFALALKAEGSVEQLRGGVELIVKQMDEALKSMQVVPVETVGTMFDPRIHEALGSIETSEFPDHQVLEEIRRGYKLRERLLRPALVKIASNPPQVSD